jgi:acyl-CoA synthetase (AMP-forming)/AMP-acid ligase II
VISGLRTYAGPVIADCDQAALEETGTIPTVLADSVREHASGTFLVDGPERYSYTALAERVEGVRNRLAGLGIGTEDRVVLWLPNSVTWMTTFFAALELGAIVVPAGTRLRTGDLRHVLEDSGARALIFTPSWFEIDFDRMVSELAEERPAGGLPALEHLISTAPSAVPAAIHLEGQADPAAATERRRGPDPGAPAIACYTSGTTGRPKGCLHTHRSLVRNGRVAAGLTRLGAGERIACPVPFAHVFGFHMGVLQAAISGSTLINAEPFSADAYLDTCEAEEATVAYAVPTMAREIVAAQRRRPRRLTLRLVLVAGAPVSPRLRASLTGADGIAEGVSVVYGCTEAPTISQLLPEDPPAERAASVGRPTPGVEVLIARAATTERVETGETGEILVRGYNTMDSYLSDPAATASKFRHGWLVTGDLGSVNASGYLHFESRADDTMLVGGFNAYPREIESRLEEGIEEVDEAAVIGVPDDRLGQVPMAWVVAEPGALEAEQVLGWARVHLPSYKRPRYVRVVVDLPRARLGKVARSQLTEQARQAMPGLDWEGGSDG